MAKKKPIPICQFPGCEVVCRKNRTSASGTIYWDRFCSFHYRKVTITRFLGGCYSHMLARVRGGNRSHNRGNWKGKPILPRDVFFTWAKNHSDFLSLYKRWVTNDFDQKLTPSINRMNSNKGYVLGNMEWMTNSQNSGLAGSVKSMKVKKEIYNLLGVNK